MANERIGIGFIGAGGIVRQRHAPGLKKIDGVEFAAVANRSKESGERAAAEFGIATVYEDWRDVIADPLVDAVLVGTWPYKHSEYSLAALAGGKHVFCQARLAMDAADGRAMAEAAADSGLTTMVCPPPHGMHAEATIMRLVKEGVLGELRNIMVRYLTPGQIDPDALLHWRQSAEFSGLHTGPLGILMEVTGRWFDYPVRVQARQATHVTERPLPDGSGMARVERPDAVSVLGELENGGQFNLVLSGVSGGGGATTIEAFGTEGSLRITLDAGAETGTLRLATAPGWTPAEVEIDPAEAGGWRVEEEFIQAIREGRSGNPSWEESVRYMEFVEAVDIAARTGQVVALKDV